MQQRNKVGGLIDRRFGENDPSMAPEDKMLERFTKEQQVRSNFRQTVAMLTLYSKRRFRGNDIFNLEDDDVLTHYGQSLGAMDDFQDEVSFGSDDEDDGNSMLRPKKRTIART